MVVPFPSPRRFAETHFSPSIFDLLEAFTKLDIFSLFSKSRKIVDSCIPCSKETGNTAFVRFGFEVEALQGVIDVNGRSYKGSKLSVQLTWFHAAATCCPSSIVNVEQSCVTAFASPLLK